MPFIHPESCRRAAFSSIFVVLPAGCRPFGRRRQPQRRQNRGLEPGQNLLEADDELNGGAYDQTVPLLEAGGRAAGTPLPSRRSWKTYAQVQGWRKGQAVATLDRFMKLHPASPAFDYALYLKGLVNFNENLGLFSGCHARTCPSATRRLPAIR